MDFKNPGISTKEIIDTNIISPGVHISLGISNEQEAKVPVQEVLVDVIIIKPYNNLNRQHCMDVKITKHTNSDNT